MPLSRKPELLTIFAIVFVDVLGFTIILPLLPFYSESFGASPVLVGAVVSVYGFCQLISGPVLGQISDRIGRRPILLISQIGTLAGLVILASARQLWMVFLARILDGITAGNITVAQAYISDVTTPQERTRAMGMIGAAFGSGFLLGPAIAGVLARFGHAAPIWAACGLSFLSICGTFFFLRDVERAPRTTAVPRGSRYRELLSNARIRPLYMAYLAFGLSFATLMSGLAMLCERRLTWNGTPFSAEEVGYLFAYSGAINLSMQTVFLGPLVKRFGEERLLRFAFTSSMTGLLILGSTTYLPVFLIGLSLNALGSALTRPNMMGLISKNVSPQQQGLALGFSQTLISLAQIVCPILSGYFIQQGAYFALTATAAAASFAGLMISRLSARDLA